MFFECKLFFYGFKMSMDVFLVDFYINVFIVFNIED